MFIEFESKSNSNLQKEFLKKGYIIKKIDQSQIDIISKEIFKITKSFTKNNKRNYSTIEFFNNLHKFIKKKKLNDIRIKIISKINKDLKFKKLIYQISKPYLDLIVGNELAMQKTLNLSIQLPKDDSSLLNIHSDSLSGESPFQVVVWCPLVNVYKTKSMFILSEKKSLKIIKKLGENKFQNFNKLFIKNKKSLKWLNIKYGEILIFSPNLLHGNVINKTKESRLSLNIRFKSLFTPYNKVKGNDRKLGIFYSPLNIKPASKLGLKFKYPNFEK